MRDSAGVAFRFVRRTPPARVSAAARVHPATRGVEVDAIPAELLLDQRAFVVGIDVCRREKRSAQSKKRFDSMFNVQAYSVGFSAAHQARTTHLAEATRTRAAGEISVHVFLLSV
jgi:hypothetical protein